MNDDPRPARSARIERLIEAPQADVFAAWADSDLLARWLPPVGLSLDIESFEFREGSTLALVFNYGQADPWAKTGVDHTSVRMRFAEISAPDRLRLEVTFLTDQPGFEVPMRSTWTYEPIGPHTRVVVETEDIPEGMAIEDHKSGVTALLANLARVMKPVSKV
ncbi:SRPBCC domain-containing protein [Pseudooceanicola sp.]|uniref:SRPBCC domain-containing protein n=1 Tax=Pseudooceanicola sp. TaxID=1914328 RepID=UPI00261CA321|nr:SRPBCC domain-containing protein [Pseudooceanicola sp.]MDF1855971.1 SRPBCC domain-containing protein [Pseudooceanicola sp.]